MEGSGKGDGGRGARTGVCGGLGNGCVDAEVARFGKAGSESKAKHVGPGLVEVGMLNKGGNHVEYQGRCCRKLRVRCSRVSVVLLVLVVDTAGRLCHVFCSV